MCGICGQINIIGNNDDLYKNVKIMTRAMIHRGPDDEGYYFDNNIGFGFRRLSIIDLSGGHQPMSDENEEVYVIFNGEIYNFIELRNQLQSYGYVFRTKSDTEVIIHGYRKWGIEFLNCLNGMFGLAIWDKRNRKYLIARDRFGIKPVYYKIDSEKILFASEIKCILSVSKLMPTADSISIYNFLRYRYVASPRTIFNGINKLAPGCFIHNENGQVYMGRWYKYKPTIFDPIPAEKNAIKELKHLYTKAVERHLISDVPLGLLLSGGLDSGLLLALMKKYGNTWKTYTIGFGKSFKNDEIEAAKRIAKHFGTQNISVELDQEGYEKTLSKVMLMMEEPVASASIVPMFLICERAREDVKVVLMGQGPDELFGGYKRHLGVYYGKYWRMLPELFRRTIGELTGPIAHNEAIRRGLYSVGVSDRLKRYQAIFSILNADNIKNIFKENILPGNVEDGLIDNWREFITLMDQTEELGGLQFIEIRSTLPDELLLYADKLSMAHGLEVRVPYLDKEIAEYVERLPDKYKVRYGNGKYLHRKICMEYLGSKIISRKKLGFDTPIDEWFRKYEHSKMEDNLLDEESLIYNYLRYDQINKIIKEHRERRYDNRKIIFSLIALEEWMRVYTGTTWYQGQ